MLALRVAGLALLAGLVLAPAARASLPATIETAVAPGGNASIASPTLSPTMKSATVDVVSACEAPSALVCGWASTTRWRRQAPGG
jgi:hypothetical protein